MLNHFSAGFYILPLKETAKKLIKLQGITPADTQLLESPLLLRNQTLFLRLHHTGGNEA